MATRKNGSRKTTASRKSTSSRKSTASRGKAKKQDMELWYEVGLIVLFAFMVFLFLCNFNIVGPIGSFFKHVMFGLVGITAYIFPIFCFLAVFFGWVNMGNAAAKRKCIAAWILFIVLGAFCELIAGRISKMESYSIQTLYKNSVEYASGGGILGGSVAYLLHHLFDMWGSILILLAVCIVCMVLITEKSFVKGVKKTGEAMIGHAKSSRAYAEERAKEREEYRTARRQETANKAEELKESGNPRDRKVFGVNFNSIFKKLDSQEADPVPKEPQDEVSVDAYASALASKAEEIQEAGEQVRNGVRTVKQEAEKPVQETVREMTRETLAKTLPETDEIHELRPKGSYHTQERINFGGTDLKGSSRYDNTAGVQKEEPVARRSAEGTEQTRRPNISLYHGPEESTAEEETPVLYDADEDYSGIELYHDEEMQELVPRKTAARDTKEAADLLAVKESAAETDTRPKAVLHSEKQENPVQEEIKEYRFPPVNLLQKGKSGNQKDNQRQLEETAYRLEECLRTFGVKVTITDISQGPAVTRYELQPEQGVKVSRIVNLSDDIKLNLAATDIRIEAPIPGKSAIGIEVPNKENSAVAFRELIETTEFKNFPSKLAFAVGKDISGKVVVADIAKMPHMLIAGATGSGKSVCINTLIMSILYKATPEEVKLIMIDPKVVELSVYNGIPHLLIPVVTDPKQAAGALQWGVSEMMSRYEKFAENGVRDMKGFNAKVDSMMARGEQNCPKKLPQIVIVVDELADLMMVAPGEVEEAICRLAQLARAAGIHLIIATQRPSVDVITGLIKANMPSRVAFAVSSGVDSRTILDMNGAEKLLGKGDMLFYPQGYSKPARIQGSFVSDNEVSNVVDFLKNQKLGNIYQEDIQNQINQIKSGSGSGANGNGKSNDRDVLFADAGRFIIEKDKASIGMLQRVFKIGFNRAARIVDQLCEYGVVGEEEGTKPRKVLMTSEQFEQLLEEI